MSTKRIIKNQVFFEALCRERQYQLRKWGDQDRPLAEWLLIARKEMNEALDDWASTPGYAAALNELLQVATVIMACFEQHPILERNWEEVYPEIAPTTGRVDHP